LPLVEGSEGLIGVAANPIRIASRFGYLLESASYTLPKPLFVLDIGQQRARYLARTRPGLKPVESIGFQSSLVAA
jgi:hypothetical protein